MKKENTLFLKIKTSFAPRLWTRNLFELLPGVTAVALLAWVSFLLSRYIGIELLGFEKSPIAPILVAILLGIMITSVMPTFEILTPGIRFSVGKILRFGIILLGIRLTVFDVLRLGVYGVPIVIICIASALLITTLINKKLNLPSRIGTLIAVGTSVCGVTAIVATSPAIEAEEEETAYAVAVITIFGLIATVAYPYLANFLFSGDAVKIGLFLGTSIHDTSQVVGAAKVYADTFAKPLALNVATVTKLVRNMSMGVIIPFLTYAYRKTKQTTDQPNRLASIGKLLPMFILGFLLMALARSVGDAGINANGKAFGLLELDAWKSTIALAQNWGDNFLVVALAGVGLSTNLRRFRGMGIRPFFVGLGAALSVGVVSYFAIYLLGNFIVY
ncbi:MAG: putative sulfate exporter family transporter [Anaerolineaceae bacterium]|nr:putative sulfate exporter family transporter [Anaerolineaceae bacterium]